VRLDESGVTQSPLANEVRAINNIDPPEAHFCAAAAALGLEPYSLDDSQAQEIVDIAQKLPPSVIAEFFVIAEYQQLRQQVAELLKGIRASQVNEADLTPLNEFKQKYVGGPSTSPWARGYHFATELRDRLALDDQRFDSLESLGAGLRVKPSELNRAVSQALRGGAALDAVVGVNKRGSPSFSIRSRTETGLMFAVCRALYEYLTTSGAEPSIVTRARSDRQKGNRAFAAEFLIPAAVLRTAMPSNMITYEDVDDLARQFGVSTTVIRHQIDNHRLGYVTEF
jgi:hypothetical protein